MKNFGRIFTLAALCAVILGSCIKEQAYKLETAQLNVNVTRAVSQTQEQGDQINDIAVWAFKCTIGENGMPVVANDELATGYNHVSNLTDTYQSVALHVPLPVCDNETQDYMVIAVVNESAFGELSTGALDAHTPYGTLLKATFSAPNVMNSHPNENGTTPTVMPVSNWAVITVNGSASANTNTHPDNCYNLELPVYRAVAKTQLYFSKSSDKFDVTISDARIVSDYNINKGFLLSACKPTGEGAEGVVGTSMYGYPNQTAGPQWFATATSYGAHDIVLKNNSSNTFTEKSITATGEEYDWVGSAFLYESVGVYDYDAAQMDGFKSVPQNEDMDADNGYYLQVTYSIGSETATRYVPLPQVVRNHDYQIKASVDKAVTGDVKIIYEVTPWSVNEIDVPSFE